MPPASGLTTEQVLLEATNHWLHIRQTNSVAYDPEDDPRNRIRGFSAYNALRKVELDGYPDDPFWSSADWDRLEQALISELDSKLAVEGSSYQHQMLIRDGRSHEAASLQLTRSSS